MNLSSLLHADSTGRWMSLTLLSDHSRDFKQGRSHFPDHGCLLSSPGVQFISICRSLKPASAGPPSLTLGRTAGGLADLLVWELTTLAAQSANTAEFKQLKPAGMAAGDAPQDQTVARREIASSPTPWQSVGMAAWVCTQSEWRTSSHVLTPDIHFWMCLFSVRVLWWSNVVGFMLLS